MSSEVWKPILLDKFMREDGTWKYEVSNFGRLKITAHKDKIGKSWKEKFVQVRDTKHGYAIVTLVDNKGKSHSMSMAKLVATNFLPNPDGSINVIHIDGDNTNNRADNLRWREMRVLRDKSKPSAPKGIRPVRQYTLKGEFIAEYPSQAVAAKAVYVSSGGQISYCCQRRPGYHTCAGFLWRFPEDDEFAGGSKCED